MGRRGGFLTVVKKAFSCQSTENREKRLHKSRRWFGSRRSSVDMDFSTAENTIIVPAAHSPMEEEVKLMEAENEQNRHAYSVALKTAVAAEAAVAAAQAAAEVVRLTAVSCNLGKTKEEIAAIRIQTAFRGYLARRALRALRSLMRLKTLIGRQSVKRQATTTLKCMQTMARMQSEIRTRRTRLSEENSAMQRQIQQKSEKELEKLRESIGSNWDDSIHSKEQVEANLQHRREATIKRERALAYAYSHQQTWKNTLNSTDHTFMDPNNPRWGWSWLERWMAARPWENRNTIENKEQNSDRISIKSTNSRSVSHQDAKINSPTAQKQSRPSSRQSPSTPNSKASKIRPASPKGADEDSKSLNSVKSERCRRHSFAGSSVRDDESLISSPAVPGYMVPTESARAKSRFSSTLVLEEKVGTLEKVSAGGSAKKRLSFSSSSPAGPRRHSGPPKVDISPVKDITTNL